MINVQKLGLTSSDIRMYQWIFVICFASSLLLMGSGLFLGTLGIDDEILVLEPFYHGIHRGLWATELVTYLLPGQNGISFIPMFLGCMLYSLAITLLIFLWELKERNLALFSAAIMGSFPYFASMMTFDVVQIAYPLGFIFIVLSVFPVFKSPFNLRIFFLGTIFFALAFALYQGVAPMVMTVFISTVGVRFIIDHNKNKAYNLFWLRYFPRFILLLVVGSILYLISVKISKYVTSYQEIESRYSVSVKLQFLDPSFYRALADNIWLIFRDANDLPRLSSTIFLICILPISISIFKISNLGILKKAIVFVLLLIGVFVLPFWLNFVQENQMTPRSSVGIAFLYGMFFVALTYNTSKFIKLAGNFIGFIWFFQFIFLGNEMYYAQHLMSKSEQITINRILARIDVLAMEKQLPYPTPVLFLGRYVPGGNKFARFNTLGSSVFSWDPANHRRQDYLFNVYGVEGLKFDYDEKLKSEISKYIVDNKVPEWPNSSSAFIYQDKIVVINFGGIPVLEWENQSKKPSLSSTKNKILFNSLVEKKLGAPDIDITLSPENSIFLHPGNTPTEAEFSIAGKFEKVELVTFIGLLPPEAFSDTLGGTVGIELFTDGELISKQYVNRNTNQSLNIDLSQVKKLTIKVECANSNCSYDWLNFGIKD